MNACYITSTGSFLPNEPVDNDNISRYLGRVIGESRIKRKILAVNGIRSRHYALDHTQTMTHSAYDLGAEAVQDCLKEAQGVDYLAAGATHQPLLAPGLASRLHDSLSQRHLLTQPLEINSNAGICSSGAQAFVNASRAIRLGDAHRALCVGIEQPSVVLKSTAFRPRYDLPMMLRDVRKSKWFMATFLRFMLSDGAGAFLLEPQPSQNGHSLKVDWTYSRSFANEAPLCMHLSSRAPLTLQQDVHVLAKYMAPLSERVVLAALCANGEDVDNYDVLLPHLSSYYFARSLKRLLKKHSHKGKLHHWTNLRTAGNTGAASIYIMLDEYVKTHSLVDGQRLLLFIPESGQFNFVIISLTVVS